MSDVTVRPSAPSEPIAVAITALAHVAIVVAVLWTVYLLLWSDAAWLHPEIVAPSSYVWAEPNNNSLGAALLKVFEWKAFDGVNRVRPINDLFEVIDGFARPYITLAVGIQASLNISTVLAGILAPAFLYGWLRRVTSSHVMAVMLTLVFISTVGFLSLIVVYWHPAKKINLTLLCGALYFAEKTARNEPGHNFFLLCICLLASFLSDELGLGNYPVIAMMYWRTIICHRRRIAMYLALPIVFLVITKWLLPLLYLHVGHSGAWSALGDGKKFSVFAYLFDFEFQKSAAIQLARSALSTIGMSQHTPITEIGVLLCLIGAPTIHAVRKRLFSMRAIADDRFLAVTFVLVIFSGYATLLDWYPFPNEISYLGSFNYYYHSPMVVLVIAWLAFASTSFDLARWALPAMAVTIFVTVSNFAIFQKINTLVEIIHFYPNSRNAIAEGLTSRSFARLDPDPAREEAKFEAILKQVFGDRWQSNGFYVTHSLLRNVAILPNSSLPYLSYIYRPWDGLNK